MKKVLSFLVALLFICSSAAAEEDLKAMTTEDLLALRNAINDELLSRGIEKEVNVPAGTYIIGTDIPAGAYTISTNAVMVVLTTQNSAGHYGEMYSVTPSEKIGKITLSDGDIISITGSVIFAPYVGLGF